MKTICSPKTSSAALRTKEGVFVAEFTERGLSQLRFPSRAAASATDSKSQNPTAKRLAAELEKYFSHRLDRFTVPLDLQSGTEFQRAVWREMKKIPAGKTRSYKEIAERIGKPNASRAVGAACGANPIPVVIPCHRVVASNGKLGGFSGGLDWKKKLLALEKV